MRVILVKFSSKVSLVSGHRRPYRLRVIISSSVSFLTTIEHCATHGSSNTAWLTRSRESDFWLAILVFQEIHTCLRVTGVVKAELCLPTAMLLVLVAVSLKSLLRFVFIDSTIVLRQLQDLSNLHPRGSLLKLLNLLNVSTDRVWLRRLDRDCFIRGSIASYNSPPGKLSFDLESVFQRQQIFACPIHLRRLLTRWCQSRHLIDIGVEFMINGFLTWVFSIVCATLVCQP